MATRAAGERWTCTCGAPLLGAMHPDTEKVAPITVAEKDDGNVLVYGNREGVLCYRPVRDEAALAWLRKSKVPLRLNHFADCPDRARYG